MSVALAPPQAEQAYTDYAHLVAALKAVRVGIPSSPPVPVLAGVLIHSGPHGLALQGFDYETAVRYQVHDQPGPEFKVAPNAALMAKILTDTAKGTTAAKMALAPVSLHVTPGDFHPEVSAVLTHEDDDGKTIHARPAVPAHSDPDILTLTIDGYQYRLESVDVTEIPAANSLTDTVISGSITLGVVGFRDALTRVTVAAGKDDTLPMLTGVQLTAAKGMVTLAATDRFRLAVDTVPAFNEPGDDFRVLAPAADLLNVMKLLDPGLVRITKVAGSTPGAVAWVRLTAGPITAALRVMDTEFVKWMQLLPTSIPTVVHTDPAKLLQALNRVTAIIDGNRQFVRVLLHTEDDDRQVEGLSLEAGTTEDGKASSPVLDAGGETDGQWMHPVHRAAAFNPVYLAAGLKHYPLTLVVGATKEGRPIVLAASEDVLNGVAPGFRYLLMPARLA